MKLGDSYEKLEHLALEHYKKALEINERQVRGIMIFQIQQHELTLACINRQGDDERTIECLMACN